MGTRRKLLVGALFLAACSFAGGAYAATSTNSSPRQAFLNDVAGRLGVSPQRLNQAFQGAEIDRLNAAVKAGRLTQAQANALEQQIRKGRHAFPFLGGRLRAPLRGQLPPSLKGKRLPPFRGQPLPPGKGGRLPGLPMFGGPISKAASYVGISQAQLFKQLAAGKSLAQIARAHGKSVAGLENVLVSAARSGLGNARAHGLITSAQEQKLLSRLRASVAKLVSRSGSGTRFGPLLGPRPPLGWRGVMRPAGPGPASAPAPGTPSPGPVPAA